MTEEVPTPETLAYPTPELAAMAEQQVRVTGGLHDGVITAELALDGAKISVEYRNTDDGFLGVDTLYAALPEALERVLGAILAKQQEAAAEEDA